MMNVLMEVEGRLPDDKQRMLAIMNRFQALSEEERLNFIVEAVEKVPGAIVMHRF